MRMEPKPLQRGLIIANKFGGLDCDSSTPTGVPRIYGVLNGKYDYNQLSHL